MDSDVEHTSCSLARMAVPPLQLASPKPTHRPPLNARSQLGGLKDRLDVWISKVNAVGATLEQESIGVAEV